MPPKILILAQNEICYNPRLLKAADFLYSKGCSVTVYNPITGIASEKVYKQTLSSRKWNVIEIDISKRKLLSRLNWLYVSIVNKTIDILWKNFRIKIGFDYYMIKGLIGATSKLNTHYDLILIHLVDSLPFAVKLKNKYNAKLIYDSQEYFKGQYNKYAKHLQDWVNAAENKYIHDVDILIATTNVMKERIVLDHKLTIPNFRVRNLPYSTQIPSNKSKNDQPELKLVWHGMTIYLDNTRGVHILVKAVAACKANVKLYLQGIINASQQEVLNNYIKNYNLENKIIVLPPANPDNIVQSLTGYDIGLIGELPEEENQQLTSSNKLFDYINAGLAVLSPDLPGLSETLSEYNVGLNYPTGNYSKLAELIDTLAKDKELLHQLKQNAEKASKELYWEKDYEQVWEQIEILTL